VNLAGFRGEDGFVLERLRKWGERCAVFGAKPRGSYRLGKDRKRKKAIDFEEKEWGNVYGVLCGEWLRVYR
jgi:hypothetical protein